MTNSDVIVSQSFDRGRTWSAPVGSDAAAATSSCRGAPMTPPAAADRHVRPAVRRRESPVRLLAGDRDRAGNARLHDEQGLDRVAPIRRPGNRWFAATLNPAFPFATTFIGDYSNIAATPSGGVVAYWTDLREQACFAGICGHGSDGFFAAVP